MTKRSDPLAGQTGPNVSASDSVASAPVSTTTNAAPVAAAASVFDAAPAIVAAPVASAVPASGRTSPVASAVPFADAAPGRTGSAPGPTPPADAVEAAPALLSRLVGTPAAAPTASSPVGSDSFDGSDPRLTAIAAVAANGVIGDGAGLLWRLPEDLAHFKRTTLGGVLLLGRRTYDSLGVALPGRQLIVISRAAGPGVAYCPLSEDNLPKGGPAGLDGLIAAGLERFEVQAGRLLPRPGPAPAFAAGVFVASSPDLALRLLAWYPERTWWCAGGGQIYAALWPYTTDLDLTEVHASVAGAVSFPVVDPVYWIETRRQEGGEFDFVGYRRRTFDARQRLAEIMVSAPRPDPGDA